MPRQTPPPIIVFHGNDEHAKSRAVSKAIDKLLPPDVDRGLALADYDGSENPEQGGPSIAGVLEDLNTLPFLTDRRVVVIRNADKFLSRTTEQNHTYRALIEKYLDRPSSSSTLILECRSFPANQRLPKKAKAIGEITTCDQPKPKELAGLIVQAATERGKKLRPEAATRLIDLIKPDSTLLTNEVDKLCLYVADRPEITDQDVTDLIGRSREEVIFAAMDQAALGNAHQAVALWHNTLASDSNAIYRVIGGMCYSVRNWLAAHQLAAEGASKHALAGALRLYGRPEDAQALLRRVTPGVARRLLAAIAHLDAQAKHGLQSIETGVESLLLRLARM